MWHLQFCYAYFMKVRRLKKDGSWCSQLSVTIVSTPPLDVLWGQRIKLIQVASNSELDENQWNDLLFFEIVPSHCFGAPEALKIDCLKD